MRCIAWHDASTGTISFLSSDEWIAFVQPSFPAIPQQSIVQLAAQFSTQLDLLQYYAVLEHNAGRPTEESCQLGSGMLQQSYAAWNLLASAAAPAGGADAGADAGAAAGAAETGTDAAAAASAPAPAASGKAARGKKRQPAKRTKRQRTVGSDLDEDVAPQGQAQQKKRRKQRKATGNAADTTTASAGAAVSGAPLREIQPSTTRCAPRGRNKATQEPASSARTAPAGGQQQEQEQAQPPAAPAAPAAAAEAPAAAGGSSSQGPNTDGTGAASDAAVPAPAGGVPKGNCLNCKQPKKRNNEVRSVERAMEQQVCLRLCRWVQTQLPHYPSVTFDSLVLLA